MHTNRKKDEHTDPIEQEHAPRTVTLRTHALRIDVVDGMNAGLTVEVPGPTMTIGSDPRCNLILNDPTVSRVHLELRIEREILRLVDQGSLNGTIVDGVRVRDAYPRPDSIIRLGKTALRLRMLSEIVEVPMSPNDHFGNLKGRSAAMRLVFAELERAARSGLNVLIEGETGTGKELAAEGVHEASRRANGPFVVLDCSVAHDTLFDSHIFGHLRGSYTGALSNRSGVFEEADGGTLFIDEIGELPKHQQAKLLRAIQEGKVRRIGENHYRNVDVRIVSATNLSLAREVERGNFREDLYYRLAEVKVRIPALRERPEDIPMLVRHFEAEFADEPRAALSDEMVRELAQQSWPGNARELLAAVRRACAMGVPGSKRNTEPAITMPLEVNVDVPLLEGLAQLRTTYEKAYVELALKRTKGNVSRAAKLAGVGRRRFYDAMNRMAPREKE